MELKYGLVAIPILIALLAVVTINENQILSDQNSQTQQISEEIHTQVAEAEEQKIREYTLIIEATDIQVSDNAIWHAWTYNGTVPAPTLHVNQGELLKVRVINNHNLTHSFHAHLTDYDMKHDGSPVNVITGVGAGSMIPPGGEWTYEYNMDNWGNTFSMIMHHQKGEELKIIFCRGCMAQLLLKEILPKRM
jgi:FtsP/CotA-like multicopper oxidase with cupredoxin domain